MTNNFSCFFLGLVYAWLTMEREWDIGNVQERVYESNQVDRLRAATPIADF